MTDAARRLWGIDMLNVPRSDIPAVTHVDYSARMQTVSRQPRLTIRADKGVRAADRLPVVVNTSFNVRGEPIVCTPEDAYRCFMERISTISCSAHFSSRKDGNPNGKRRRIGDRNFNSTERGGGAEVRPDRWDRVRRARCDRLVAGTPDSCRRFWAMGGLLIFAGVAFPRRLGPVQRAWMGFAHAISKVTTPIFMGLVYYAVLTPTGVLMRMFGRNSLAPHRAHTSHWVSRGEDRRSDLQRQF